MRYFDFEVKRISLGLPDNDDNGFSENDSINFNPEYIYKFDDTEKHFIIVLLDEDDDEENGVSGRYLLLSADSKCLQEAGFSVGTRLYFNARIEQDDNGIISLSDGKITRKKALQTGFWGLFNSSGILAQFRVIGDFICKPI